MGSTMLNYYFDWVEHQVYLGHEDRVCLVRIEWKFEKLYQRQIPIYVSRVQNTVTP